MQERMRSRPNAEQHREEHVEWKRAGQDTRGRGMDSFGVRN